MLLSVPMWSLADAWDDLSAKQAKMVTKYLAKNPFILDYCDCCDNSPVYLMEVKSSQIVHSEWSEGKFAVKVNAFVFGQLERESYPTAYRVESMNETKEYTITMNYTFVYSKYGKWAVPFFKMVDYDREHVCAGATRFPSPKDNKDIHYQPYVNWYNKYVGSK